MLHDTSGKLNISLSRIQLEKGEAVPVKSYPNASLLLYCVQGKLSVSFVLPKVNQVKAITVTTSQVVNIPQGCWHHIQANENSQGLVIFDCLEPQPIDAAHLHRLKGMVIDATTVQKAARKAVELHPYYHHHGRLAFPVD